MRKYNVKYYHCPNCRFLQTERPYWLEEAYQSPIVSCDTGVLQRNLTLARITSVMVLCLLHKEARCLDYAGGYGIFTRRMRDIGFDFYWYDKYTQNLMARGFEYSPDLGPVQLVTSFESVEHFVDPVEEVRKMSAISTNILFTNMVLPKPVPRPGEWWYYGLDDGQHISFYSLDTLNYIAGELGLRFRTNGRNLHLFTASKISNVVFSLLAAVGFLCGDSLARAFVRTKTIEDMEYMRSCKTG